jgi:hypothetical protein
VSDDKIHELKILISFKIRGGFCPPEWIESIPVSIRKIIGGWHPLSIVPSCKEESIDKISMTVDTGHLPYLSSIDGKHSLNLGNGRWSKVSKAKKPDAPVL